MIIMHGPSPKLHGGIATCIGEYERLRLIDGVNVKFVATVESNRKLGKAFNLVVALIRTIALICFKNVSLFHIHLAAKNSLFRKSLFFAVAKIFRIPVVIHLHSGMFLDWIESGKGINLKLLTFCLKNADAVIVLSPIWVDKLTAIISIEKIYVINNHLDIPVPVTTNSTTKYILFSGRLSAEKGAYDLLKAFAGTDIMRHNSSLVYMGDGDSLGLRSLASELGVSDKIKILGWKEGEEKREVIRNACCLALPSYFEGFPYVVIESLAYGVPAICSNVGGIPDHIFDGKNGYVHNPGDIKALTDAINTIMGLHPTDYKMMSNYCRNYYEMHFTSQSSLQKISALYTKFSLTFKKI